ncbi:MAG: M1 family metallopeptidase [Gemmatimonadota bacterium]|nr:M1 family metallopeptidase [Gemmatimonadota bacterium]
MIVRLVAAAAVSLLPWVSAAQDTPTFTRADTLRGSNTPERAWWDAAFYDLAVRINPADSSIAGRNTITYRVLAPAREMQIDLQQPLVVDSIVQDGGELSVRREGNALFVRLLSRQPIGARKAISVYYQGKPVVAVNPPWDGGFIWARDSLGNPWIATANQGLGASVWWPNKDIYSDEPDSQRVAITVPDPLVNVSNGRLRRARSNGDGTTTFEWFVRSPINNYNIAVNAGKYAHFSDVYYGEGGRLSLDFWPLAYNLDTARKHFQQTKPVLKCFETWFGPFPWYRDGFKLVETPHLGMEHQSAIAYGNRYLNGYRGRDRSETGHGLRWDFIIVHEAAHEWWGNNVSMSDAADMWIHESFADYAEGLYTECQQGKLAGAEYIIGKRAGIANDRPIVGLHGLNYEGSGDMYNKGGNMLHTIRQLVNDDARWRRVLRGINTVFGRRTVSGKQIEEYMSRNTRLDLDKVFDQYLRTNRIPVLEYRIEGTTLSYRWADAVPGFDMPVKVTLSPNTFRFIQPIDRWLSTPIRLPLAEDFRVDENFYVLSRDVLKPVADSAR